MNATEVQVHIRRLRVEAAAGADARAVEQQLRQGLAAALARRLQPGAPQAPAAPSGDASPLVEQLAAALAARLGPALGGPR